jgi:hypothetical protein
VSLLNYLNTDDNPEPNPPPPIGKIKISIDFSGISSKISRPTVA